MYAHNWPHGGLPASFSCLRPAHRHRGPEPRPDCPPTAEVSIRRLPRRRLQVQGNHSMPIVTSCVPDMYEQPILRNIFGVKLCVVSLISISSFKRLTTVEPDVVSFFHPGNLFILHPGNWCIQHVTVCLRHNHYARDLREALPLPRMLITVNICELHYYCEI